MRRSSMSWRSLNLRTLRPLIDRERGKIAREARDVLLAEGGKQRGLVWGVVTYPILESEHRTLQVLGVLTCQTRHSAVASKIAQVAGDALAGIYGAPRDVYIRALGRVAERWPCLLRVELREQLHLLGLQRLHERRHDLARSRAAFEVLELQVQVVILLAGQNRILRNFRSAVFAVTGSAGQKQLAHRGEFVLRRRGRCQQQRRRRKRDPHPSNLTTRKQ